MLGQERLARLPCTFPSPVLFRFSDFRTLALLPTEGPEPCRLLEQVTYMSHCGFCVSEENVCVSRYLSPQFVRTGFTDHSSRLSVSPTVCDQKTRVLVRSACRTLKILPLSLLGQHMDRAASDDFQDSLLPRHCVLYLWHHHSPPHHRRGPYSSFCLHSACSGHSLGPSTGPPSVGINGHGVSQLLLSVLVYRCLYLSCCHPTEVG